MGVNRKLASVLPRGLGASMSTRHGGHSLPPYDSLNLGDHVGDAPDSVSANRATLAQSWGVRPVFMRQLHGTQVLTIDRDTPDGMVADACWTRVPGVACTVMVADCLPVLVWDAQARWVAAAHAGWRGLAEGVLEALWASLHAEGAPMDSIRAWLGPCIGPRAFEVGPEVVAAFVGQEPECLRHFQPGQGAKAWADLSGLARDRLQRLGVMNIAGNDSQIGDCTVSQPGLYFSHRRDAVGGGQTGRMAAGIWIQSV